MHSGVRCCCLLARRPIQLTSLPDAAPQALPGRRILPPPWARPGFGATVLMLRRPSRRKPRGAAKSPDCRFHFAAAGELSNSKRSHHEKLQEVVLASKTTLQFEHGLSLQSGYVVPEDVKAAGFQIDADELASIVESRDSKKLTVHGQLDGIADKLATSLTDGISTDEDLLNQRQEIYGVNKFTESEVRGFWEFVWEAMQDTTLIILIACAFVSLVVGIAMEGWPTGAHDGIGIVASILLVVSVTATSDYRQSLQFRDLDKEKRKILVQVTRNGFRQRILIDDLFPGDVVHLAVGDQVPADGLFIYGFSVLVNESSLTGESEPVFVNEDNPFLLSGTKVLDGSCKMLVTAAGMRTQWGKLMAVLTDGGNDETPLQVKLNGVANIIGKIGLFFAVLTFIVLSQGLIGQKYHDELLLSWSGDDVLEILEHFAVAVTIVVVAVPEGLPLAVTLSLAFAMKKMMNDKALVRQLAACETMGSATVICSDKTGTLTTNRTKAQQRPLRSIILATATNLLLFQNHLGSRHHQPKQWLPPPPDRRPSPSSPSWPSPPSPSSPPRTRRPPAPSPPPPSRRRPSPRRSSPPPPPSSSPPSATDAPRAPPAPIDGST